MESFKEYLVPSKSQPIWVKENGGSRVCQGGIGMIWGGLHFSREGESLSKSVRCSVTDILKINKNREKRRQRCTHLQPRMERFWGIFFSWHLTRAVTGCHFTQLLSKPGVWQLQIHSEPHFGNSEQIAWNHLKKPGQQNSTRLWVKKLSIQIVF